MLSCWEWKWSQGASRHRKLCSSLMLLLTIVTGRQLCRSSHSCNSAAVTADRLDSLLMYPSQTCSSYPARAASAWAPVEQRNTQQQQQAPALTSKSLNATQAGAIRPVCDGPRAAAEVGCPVR